MLGYVDYIDAFGIRRRAGYARFYDPSLDQRSAYEDRLTVDSNGQLTEVA
jgi:hypothetical protein